MARSAPTTTGQSVFRRARTLPPWRATIGPARREAARPIARSPGRRSPSRLALGTVPLSDSLCFRLMSSIRTNAPTVSPAPQERFAPRPEAAALLAWYDRHRRDLPWRARAGDDPQAFHGLLNHVLLQQNHAAAHPPLFF